MRSSIRSESNSLGGGVDVNLHSYSFEDKNNSRGFPMVRITRTYDKNNKNLSPRFFIFRVRKFLL